MGRRQKVSSPKKSEFERRFFFDHVGAKRKAHFAAQSCKKKAPMRGFRRLRTATRAPCPRLRRLLKKAGENFRCLVYSLKERHGGAPSESGFCSALQHCRAFYTLLGSVMAKGSSRRSSSSSSMSFCSRTRSLMRRFSRRACLASSADFL